MVIIGCDYHPSVREAMLQQSANSQEPDGFNQCLNLKPSPLRRFSQTAN